MNKYDKELAEITVNAAEELCKQIDGFNELNNDMKAIATIFASIALLNKAFNTIQKNFK